MGTRLVISIGTILLIIGSARVAHAAGEPPWLSMGMELFGGLAIFLFGMEQMTVGMRAVAGRRMKSILAKLTSNRFLAVITGAFVTAVIQSSSVTTVLVVGFITAGLLSLSQAIGIIMGANIGTTITAQIIAFKITKASLPIIGVGFCMWFFGRRGTLRSYGSIIMGLGMVFLGMTIMSDGMHPLRAHQPFLDLMASMENPLLGIAVAAIFTGLVQSSSATTGVVIAMASQGLITLPAGIALAFGANVGTCVTAIIAAIGKPREAMRASAAHVVFNMAGVLVWVGFIDQLADFVTWVSPANGDLAGAERLAADVPRQIANAHTFFNVANTVLFIGFAGVLARIVERLIPDAPLQDHAAERPKYLAESLLVTPSLALDAVRRELGRIGVRVQDMLQSSMPALLAGDIEALEAVAAKDAAVDDLYGHVVTYLGRLNLRPLTESESSQLTNLLAAANDLENIGDIVETNLVTTGNRLISNNVAVSEQTQVVLRQIHAKIYEALTLGVDAVVKEDPELAKRVVDMKSEINALADEAARHQAARLVADAPNRLEAYACEMDIIERLKRVYYFTKRIAKPLLGETSA